MFIKKSEQEDKLLRKEITIKNYLIKILDIFNEYEFLRDRIAKWEKKARKIQR